MGWCFCFRFYYESEREVRVYRWFIPSRQRFEPQTHCWCCILFLIIMLQSKVNFTTLYLGLVFLPRYKFPSSSVWMKIPAMLFIPSFLFLWLLFCCRALVLLKQFLGYGYTGWFAITFPTVVFRSSWRISKSYSRCCSSSSSCGLFCFTAYSFHRNFLKLGIYIYM